MTAEQSLDAEADMPNDRWRLRRPTDYMPIEKTPPIESWGKSLLTGLVLIAFIIAAFWASGMWARL